MRSILRVLILFLLTAAGITAQPAPEVAKEIGPPELTREDLERFMETTINTYLETSGVPGMTVSVVKDGEVLLATGYGYAVVEKRIPVDGATSLYRIGSVSKTVTAIAVMQLVEQGKLDLEADVNTYLGEAALPDTFPEPITLTHLMTHTAGFQEISPKYIDAATVDDILPLSEAARVAMPGRVFPPGRYGAYSNYGAALAAYIVEAVSGIPYDDYVERYITGPLGLEYFTVRQPVPERLLPHLTTGYDVGGGAPSPRPFQLLTADYPAGSVSASAGDMARYMIMLLQNGELDGTRILSEQSARAMQSVVYKEDPRARGGLGYIFFISDLNGHRTIGHGGGMNEFLTDMTMLPDENVGFFISASGTPSEPWLIQRLFLDRYFPLADQATPASSPDAVERLKRYEGLYQSSRTGYTNITIFINLVGARAMDVRVHPDGKLIVRGDTYVEVEPDVFRAEDGTNRIVFRDNPDTGRLDFVMDAPGVYFKVPWHQQPGLHMRLAVVLTLVLLTAVLGWPVGAWLKRRWQVASTAPSRVPRWVVPPPPWTSRPGCRACRRW